MKDKIWDPLKDRSKSAGKQKFSGNKPQQNAYYGWLMKTDFKFKNTNSTLVHNLQL